MFAVNDRQRPVNSRQRSFPLRGCANRWRPSVAGQYSTRERITMNALTKWDPFKDWDPFRELNEFQNRLGTFFGRTPASRELENYSWSPAVDIIEDDKEFLVKAELPEVRKEDVHVSVEGGVLTIRGERKFE